MYYGYYGYSDVYDDLSPKYELATMSPNLQSINGQKMTISGTVKILILFLIQCNSIITR